MKLKAVYTLEAAVIFSLCFILFGAAVSVTYGVYQDSMNTVNKSGEEFDAVNTFRKIDILKDSREELMKKGK